MIFCSRLGAIYEGAIYECFFVCVQMSRNVVVSFAEGYSDVLDDKKIGGYMIFCSRFGGGGLYSRGLYTRGCARGFPVAVTYAGL